MRPLIDANEFYASAAVVVFLVFVFASSVTMMNMLIGVICEVVKVTATNERDSEAIRALKTGVLVQLQKFDVDGSNTISKQELEQVINDDSARQVLVDFGVDLQHLASR